MRASHCQAVLNEKKNIRNDICGWRKKGGKCFSLGRWESFYCLTHRKATEEQQNIDSSVCVYCCFRVKHAECLLFVFWKASGEWWVARLIVTLYNNNMDRGIKSAFRKKTWAPRLILKPLKKMKFYLHCDCDCTLLPWRLSKFHVIFCKKNDNRSFLEFEKTLPTGNFSSFGLKNILELL